MLSVHTCPLAMMGGKKTGGMNVYVRDLARELGRMGIQVDVFTRSEDDCQPQIKHDLGFGARVIHIAAGPEVPVHPREIVAHLDEFVSGVIEFSHEEEASYDLIHSHYWLSGLVAEKLRQAWEPEFGDRLPIVQMFHTLGHMKNKINPDDAEKASEDRIDGEHHIIHHVADAIIAPTPVEKEQLLNLYDADPAIIHILPPGVDLSRFMPLDRTESRRAIGIPCQGKNIMFVGRIEPLKGIDTLIEAAAILRRRMPDLMEKTCFSIVGGDPWAENPAKEMKRLQALRDELHVSDVVGFLGAKNQNELPKYYAAAEVVVMPSHYESFGLVALEAMAMGTPVIASEVGGLAHLVKDGVTGFHVPSRDPEALADRICCLLSDSVLRNRLGRQAKRYAHEYDWHVITERMIDFYHSLISPQPVVEAAVPVPCLDLF
ncbi:MAG: glycosyltransferase [Ardenticatenaceae bacterium]|nr:glycosyltransferase [Ardenticatenaceae bacterium]